MVMLSTAWTILLLLLVGLDLYSFAGALEVGISAYPFHEEIPPLPEAFFTSLSSAAHFQSWLPSWQEDTDDEILTSFDGQSPFDWSRMDALLNIDGASTDSEDTYEVYSPGGKIRRDLDRLAQQSASSSPLVNLALPEYINPDESHDHILKLRKADAFMLGESSGHEEILLSKDSVDEVQLTWEVAPEIHRHLLDHGLLDVSITMGTNVTILVTNNQDNLVADATYCYPTTSTLCNLRSAWLACGQINLATINSNLAPGVCTIELATNATLMMNPANGGSLVVTKAMNILLRGNQARVSQAYIDPNGPSNFLYYSNSSTSCLSYLTRYPVISITNVSFARFGKDSTSGGFMYSFGDIAVSVQSVRITNTTAYSGGVFYMNYNTIGIQIKDCSFARNIAVSGGGVLASGYVIQNVLIQRTQFQQCVASYGGCLRLSTSPMNIWIENSTFTACKAKNSGGMLYLGTNTNNVTLLRNNFVNVTATYGGVVYWYTGTTLQIVNSTFLNCYVTGSGSGGIWYVSSGITDMLVSGSYFKGCKGTYGACGCIIRGNNIVVTTSYFFKCASSYWGGAMYFETPIRNVSITNSIFNQVAALYTGGVINMYTATNVNMSSLAFYSCASKSSSGGAIGLQLFNTNISMTNITASVVAASGSGALVYLNTNNTNILLLNVTANNILTNFGGILAASTNNTNILFSNFYVKTFKAYQSGIFNFNLLTNNAVVRNGYVLNGIAGFCGVGLISRGSNVTVRNMLVKNVTATDRVLFPVNALWMIISNNNTVFQNVTCILGTTMIRATNAVNFTLRDVSVAQLNTYGGINLQTTNQNIILDNVSVRNCSGNNGGGIFIGDNVLNVSILNSRLEDNVASNRGGGLYIDKNSPRVTLVNTTIQRNRAIIGGGVFLGYGARQTAFVPMDTYRQIQIAESPHPYVSKSPIGTTRYVIYGKNVTASNARKFLLIFSELTVIDVVDNIIIYTDYTKTKQLLYISSKGIPGVDAPIAIIPGPSFYIEFVGPAANQIIQTGYYGFKLFAYPVFPNQMKSIIHDNIAVTKGGAIHFDYATSFPLLMNLDVSRNKVINGQGGGMSFQISNSGALLLQVDMNSNYAKYDGGAIAFLSGQYGVIMAEASFANNRADGNGGAHFFASSNGIGIFAFQNNITYYNCQLEGNVAGGSGGAIFAQTENSINLFNSTITNNIANENGGGIGMEELDYFNVTTSVISNNSAISGGGISATTRSTIVLNGSMVLDNSASKAGGGLFLKSNSVLVAFRNVQVNRNTAGEIGGAIVLFSTFWWLLGSSTATLQVIGNSATRGSAVFVKSLQTRPFLNIGVSTIANNEAQGGTVYWIYDKTMLVEPPALTNPKVVLVNNTAVFGSRAATQALQVIPPAKYTVNVYGINLQPPINVTLLDYYGQFVNITGDTTVYPSISHFSCTQYPYLAGSNTLNRGVTLEDGIASFAALQTFCSPTGNITLTFTAEIGILIGLPETSLQPYYLTNISFLSFRACTAGEYESKGLCIVCPQSSYSLHSGSTECESCLSVAGIKTCGGSSIVVEPGFWRRTDASSVVFTCVLAPESCPGGYGTGDASCGIGYEGPLCSVCTDGYYINNNQCTSCEGTGKITGTTWAVAAMSAVALLIVAYLYYQNYKMNKLLEKKEASVNASIGLDEDSPKDSEEGQTDKYPEAQEAQEIQDEEEEDIDEAMAKSTIHLDYSTTSQFNTLQLIMLWVKMKYSALMVKIKIIVSTFQVITSTASIFSVTLPHSFTNFMNVFKIFNLSVTSIIPLACENDYSFIDTLLWTTLTPIGIAFLLCIAFFVEFAFVRHKIQSQKQRRKGAKQQAFHATKDKYLNYFFYLTYLVLPSVSTTIFQMFVCTNVDPKNEDDYHYDWYLNADMSISCETPFYTNWLLYAVVMVFIYPIGIPVFYLYLLYSNRAEISSREEEATSNSATSSSGEAKLTGNPMHDNAITKPTEDSEKAEEAEATVETKKKMSNHAARLSFLWQAYLPSYWYWEVVESTRRIVLTAVLSVTSPGSSKQSVFGVLLAFCYIVINSTYKPYHETSDATLGEMGQIQIFLTFFAALVIQNSLMSSKWDTMLGGMLTLVNLLVIGYTFYFEYDAYQSEQKEAEANAEEERRRAANRRIAAHYLAANNRLSSPVTTRKQPNNTIAMKFERKSEIEFLDQMETDSKNNQRFSKKHRVPSQFVNEDRASTMGVELPEWKPKKVESTAEVFARPPIVVEDSAANDVDSLRQSISQKYRDSRGSMPNNNSIFNMPDSDDEDD